MTYSLLMSLHLLPEHPQRELANGIRHFFIFRQNLQIMGQQIFHQSQRRVRRGPRIEREILLDGKQFGSVYVSA